MYPDKSESRALFRGWFLLKGVKMKLFFIICFVHLCDVSSCFSCFRLQGKIVSSEMILCGPFSDDSNWICGKKAKNGKFHKHN